MTESYRVDKKKGLLPFFFSISISISVFYFLSNDREMNDVAD